MPPVCRMGAKEIKELIAYTKKSAVPVIATGLVTATAIYFAGRESYTPLGAVVVPTMSGGLGAILGLIGKVIYDTREPKKEKKSSHIENIAEDKI